ncbi:MAG: SRPBCC domain-containing protein [Chloroflexi bacterium]|nr:SRPBCC domain-containing protein [Chloroflexota bacterium]
MSDSFSIARALPATPEQVYEAWLDGDQHSEMTGAGATANAKVGGAFTAWDGYIEGTNVELVEYGRIVQRWRTLEFPVDAPDSLLEITLEPSNGGTLITINHSEIPDGQGDSYKTGWVDHYFEPMAEHFRLIY